mmetsp:Transcript_25497/g.66733  ORF Transcript_25497/g.66733 Transcript_25497/m.66733 type:complete len:303 (-) Transcript_25497:879-1787(-)
MKVVVMSAPIGFRITRDRIVGNALTYRTSGRTPGGIEDLGASRIGIFLYAAVSSASTCISRFTSRSSLGEVMGRPSSSSSIVSNSSSKPAKSASSSSSSAPSPPRTPDPLPATICISSSANWASPNDDIILATAAGAGSERSSESVLTVEIRRPRSGEFSGAGAAAAAGEPSGPPLCAAMSAIRSAAVGRPRLADDDVDVVDALRCRVSGDAGACARPEGVRAGSGDFVGEVAGDFVGEGAPPIRWAFIRARRSSTEGFRVSPDFFEGGATDGPVAVRARIDDDAPTSPFDLSLTDLSALMD